MLGEPSSQAVVTIKDAAERLDVSEVTLRRWDKSGRFTARRHPINNYRLYDADAVEQLARALAGVEVKHES